MNKWSESIHRNERGFMLLTELVVVCAILGIMGIGLNMTIIGMTKAHAVNAGNMTVAKQIENAVHWISRDVQMSATVNLSGDDDGFPLQLSWTEWDGTTNEITYTLYNGELTRSHSENGSEVSQNFVAQFIDTDSSETNAQLSGDALVVTITAAIQDDNKSASRSRVFEATTRANYDGT